MSSENMSKESVNGTEWKPENCTCEYCVPAGKTKRIESAFNLLAKELDEGIDYTGSPDPDLELFLLGWILEFRKYKR